MMRFKSLAVLAFNNINQKRACLLARQHIAGQPVSCARASPACLFQSQHSQVASNPMSDGCRLLVQRWRRGTRVRTCWPGRPWRDRRCASGALWRTCSAAAPALLRCRCCLSCAELSPASCVQHSCKAGALLLPPCKKMLFPCRSSCTPTRTSRTCWSGATAGARSPCRTAQHPWKLSGLCCRQRGLITTACGLRRMQTWLQACRRWAGSGAASSLRCSRLGGRQTWSPFGRAAPSSSFNENDGCCSVCIGNIWNCSRAKQVRVWVGYIQH